MNKMCGSRKIETRKKKKKKKKLVGVLRFLKFQVPTNPKILNVFTSLTFSKHRVSPNFNLLGFKAFRGRIEL
jgi:hypothetical protein